MFREQFFPLSHGRLNVAVGPPHGPPLILLHGVLRNWSDFVPLLPSLAARWQLFALDHRGHGASDRVMDRYLVTDYAHDAVEFITQYVSEPAVIYGHSLGAMVALAASATVQHIRGIVLEDPPFETMGAGIENTTFHSLFFGIQAALMAGGTDPQLIDRMAEIKVGPPGHVETTRLGDVRDRASLRFSARCLQQVDPEVLTPIVRGRWLEGYETSRIAAEVACPTLLLQADRTAGGMLTDDTRRLLEERIPDCSVIQFANSGHLLHWCATQQLLSPVLMFLESLRCGL